jgi:uncharacterized protein (DUF952 family)
MNKFLRVIILGIATIGISYFLLTDEPQGLIISLILSFTFGCSLFLKNNLLRFIMLLIGTLTACYFFQGDLMLKKQDLSSSKIDQNGIYKIVPISDFNKKTKQITLSKLDNESAFIHASKGSQLEKIIGSFFNDFSELYILQLDENILKQNFLEIRMEQNKPNGSFYPHIYGNNKQIPAQAIKKIFKFAR